jgi:hypothetical protein
MAYIRDIPRIFTLLNISKGFILSDLNKPYRVLLRYYL